MATLEPCTSWRGEVHRRHLSTNLGPAVFGTGQEGHALCHTDTHPVEVFDQARYDRFLAESGREPVDIASLPECKVCARSAHLPPDCGG